MPTTISVRLLPAFAFCMWMLSALTAPARAAIYYISPNGSDNNPGTQSAPFLDIQAGVNTAHDGDTVLIADGTYTGPGNHDIDFGGKNLIVKSQHGAASTIIDCGVSDRSADHRGFYLHSNETHAVISGLTIENGYSNNSNGGGGMLIINVSVAIRGCIIRNNKTGISAGGGIAIFSGYDAKRIDIITIVGCEFTGNSAAEEGGGIKIGNQGGGKITVTGCNFANNSAGIDGGGMWNLNLNYIKGGSIVVNDCIFKENSAANGGGMDNKNLRDGTINVINCTLNNNSTKSITLGSGGGMFNVSAGRYPLVIKNCALIGNTTPNGDGGGMYNQNKNTENGNATIITNCIFANNTAPTGNGGGVYNSNEGGSPIALTNCTLTGNSANGTGGVYNLNSNGNNTFKNTNTIILINDIIYGDTGSEITNDRNSVSNAIASHCDVQGGYAGVGNINADPQFVNSPGDVHLNSGSPCLGAGIAVGAPSTDKQGKIRPSRPSIGAYE